MKATEFQNKFLDKNIPTFIRNIAEKAVDEINAGNFDTIEVTEPELHALSRYANYPIIKPSMGSTFIRIYDGLDNSKDIQTLNPFNK